MAPTLRENFRASRITLAAVILVPVNFALMAKLRSYDEAVAGSELLSSTLLGANEASKRTPS